MITSSHNARLKEIRFLKDKKYRDENGLFTVEGVKAVSDALFCGVAVKYIMTTEKVAKSCALVLSGVETETVSDALFESVSDEKTPQGVIAVCYKPDTVYKSPNGRCLFLDNVQDPSNVGAILRTAAACGLTEVYACGGADAFSPKAVRSSMGGVFRVNFYPVEKEKFFSELKIPIIVADMKGEDLFGFVPPEKFCLVIGNEGRGVDGKITDRADYSVSIPMKNGVESLNAAVSASIIMYDFSRK